MEHYRHAEAPRVFLRRLGAEDARSFALLLGGLRKSAVLMARMPHPCTPQSARTWIESHSSPEIRIFGIVRRSDGDFLGAIGLNTGEPIPEIGYWIGRPYWSNGYATEAVRVMESLAAEQGYFRLAAETFADNLASRRVLAKSGFRQLGAFERNLSEASGQRTVCRFEKQLPL